MYRTKELLNVKKILNPILDLVEIYISEEGFLKYIGATENDSEDQIYVINNVTGKRLMFIESEYQYHFFKNNKEMCEYFNPFVKYKNVLYLLLMVAPVLYTRYSKSINVDNDDDLVTGILEDDYNIDPDELSKYINILQYPKNVKTGVSKIECICKNTEGETVEFTYENENKIAVIIILLLKIVSFIDKKPKILKELNFSTDDELYDYINESLELYSLERDRNSKDILKLSKIDNSDIDVSEQLFEDVETYDKADSITIELENNEQRIDIMNSVHKLFTIDTDSDLSEFNDIAFD